MEDRSFVSGLTLDYERMDCWLRKKLESIGRHAHDCMNDVWVGLIDGGCKRACWAVSGFDRLAASILNGEKLGQQYFYIYWNRMSVATAPSDFTTKI